MPSVNLNETDMGALVAYLQSLGTPSLPGRLEERLHLPDHRPMLATRFEPTLARCAALPMDALESKGEVVFKRMDARIVTGPPVSPVPQPPLRLLVPGRVSRLRS